MTNPDDPTQYDPFNPVFTRCPNPSCADILAQANTYVLTKLAGRLAADYTPLFTSPAYRAIRAQLRTALGLGDVEAVKARCRAWWTLVIAWTEAQPRQPTPTPAPCVHVWVKDGTGTYCFRCDTRHTQSAA